MPDTCNCNCLHISQGHSSINPEVRIKEKNSEAYSCNGLENGCNFAIWKNDKFLSLMKKEPTKEMVKTLLKDGRVEVTGLTNLDGKIFDAILSYEEENGHYNWHMRYPEKKKIDEK